jgi:dUTP pyrophosphatase
MSKYQLNIKLKESLDSEIKNYYINYKNKHEGDSGIDLVCPIELIVSSFSGTTINFNISCEMINLETNKQVSYYLYPRSSISNTPLIMANSVGVIDAGYRGDIMAKVKYNPEELYTSYTIEKNIRLFQICAPDLGTIKVNVVDELTDSTRGSGGFGSTGKSI